MRRPRVTEPEEAYFAVRGGLDLVTSPYKIDPGKMKDCFRYEVKPSGGYGPVDGFERVDGTGLPSDATFQFIEFTDSGIAIDADVEVTGSVSGAVGVSLCSGEIDFDDTGVTEDITGSGAFYIVSGEFQDGEDLNVSGSPVATVQTAYTINTESSDSHELYYHWLAVEKRRALIAEVPGSGPVRGVWEYHDNLYAFRDNVAGTECLLYKADSASGWSAVSGVPTLLPGGSFKCINTNFGGSSSTIMMYGCDGVNPAFEFDGTTFTQIATGMVADTPIDIVEHKKHLFLAFTGGSVQHSPPTDPTGTWSVVLDAGELGMGEEHGDFAELVGGSLGIFCKDSIHILYGSGVSDWDLQSHSKTSGAVPETVQVVSGKVLFVNDTGIANLNATSSYGDFKSGTISPAIQPLLDERRTKADIVGSVIVAKKNQYRVFFSDGYILTCSFNGSNPEFSQSHYSKQVSCLSAPKRATDDTGSIYFGSDDGYVYKMDSGLSLDDTPMNGYVRLPYSFQKAARRKKRYREVSIEIDRYGSNLEDLYFYPDFSFRRGDIPTHSTVDLSASSSGAAVWDLSDWNSFSWSDDSSADGGGIANGRIDGVATEIGFIFFFNASKTTTQTHVINGIFVSFNYLGRQS